MQHGMDLQMKLNSANFVEWVYIIVNNHQWDGGPCKKWKHICIEYPTLYKDIIISRLRAYGNPYQVDGDTTICMVTYYYGVVSIFKHKEVQMDNVKDYIQYVGLLKDILLMEYEIISLSIIFCDVHGVKNGFNIKGFSAFMCDEVRFFLISFLYVIT